MDYQVFKIIPVGKVTSRLKLTNTVYNCSFVLAHSPVRAHSVRGSQLTANMEILQIWMFLICVAIGHVVDSFDARIQNVSIPVHKTIFSLPLIFILMHCILIAY